MRYINCLMIILFLLSIGMLACTPSPEREQLLHIESIVDEHADSAWQLLNAIPYDRLHREEERALYGMLQAQASDKNYIVLEDDSLAFAAARYFEDKDDKHRCLIATYYGGRIQYNNGDYTSSLATFLQSKELAEELGEFFWAGMSCRGVSDVYNKFFNAADELIYAQEEYRYIQASGRQPYINYALLDLARAYCSTHDYEKSREITRQAVDSAMKYQDGYLYYAAKRLDGIGYFAKNNYEAVLSIFKLICDAGMGTTRDSAYLSMAYVGIGEQFKGEEIANLIPHGEVLFLKELRYRLLKKQGKFHDALYERLQVDSLSNAQFKERINQNLNSTIIGFYDLKKQKSDAELRAARIQMWLIVVIALVIIISITIHCIFWQRKQFADRLLFAEQLRELVARGEAEKSNSASTIKYLLASKYNLLEEFCEIVTHCSNSKTAKQKIANSVTTLIENLSLNSDRVAELEQEVDMLYHHIISDFKRDLPHLKDADYRLFLYTILGLSNTAISLFLKEDKVSSVYDRKRRLKDKIKTLAPESRERYMEFL